MAAESAFMADKRVEGGVDTSIPEVAPDPSNGRSPHRHYYPQVGEETLFSSVEPKTAQALVAEAKANRRRRVQSAQAAHQDWQALAARMPRLTEEIIPDQPGKKRPLRTTLVELENEGENDLSLRAQIAAMRAEDAANGIT